MRVFVTGATGFIGSGIVNELLRSGHKVIGLARSDAGATQLIAVGAEVHRGDLEDVVSLKSGAAKSDAVIHTAFIHDFSKYVENCEIDRRAIEAMGDALAGSKRPFVITSGTAVSMPGRIATEEDGPTIGSIPRVASEIAANAVAKRGVRVSIVRLPQVHDLQKFGLVSPVIELAREKRVSGYVGDGANRWPAVHRDDAVRVYTLALEKGVAEARYHAVAEEGIPLRQIAEVIGRRLNVPVVSMNPQQAAEHFGPFALFAGFDAPASSALTQKWLGWRPTGPGMLADLEKARL